MIEPKGASCICRFHCVNLDEHSMRSQPEASGCLYYFISLYDG